MRDGECGSLRDVRMTLQRVIDLGRRDFLAAPIDELSLAAVKGEEAVAVYAADISGAEPALDEGLGIQLRGVEVARCYGRASEQDLAVFADGKFASALRDDLKRTPLRNANCPRLGRPRRGSDSKKSASLRWTHNAPKQGRPERRKAPLASPA